MKIATLFTQLRANWRSIAIVHLMFTLLGIAVLTPLFGLLLQGTLALTGAEALVDQDIARTLLSPIGLVGGIVLVAVLLAITGLELGALQLIAQGSRNGQPVPPAFAARYALLQAPLLVKITLRFTLYVLAYVLPYLAIVAALAWTQLTAYDINYYLIEKPPVFFAVVAAAGLLAIPLVWLLGRKLISWCLVLPIALFEDKTAAQAFRHSEALVGERRVDCLRRLISWLLLAAALSAVPILVLNIGMEMVLANPDANLTTLAAILGLLGLIWAVLNFLVAALNLAGFSLVIAELYEQFTATPIELPTPTAVAGKQRFSGWTPARIGLVSAVVILASGAVLMVMLKSVSLDDEVLVIAHRGAAGAAPENTLASINQAIADGADWIEIDVQESRDGEVVVVHDSDFMKLAGDPIKVWEGDLGRLQSIDIGSWFDPRFKDERVPTLAQVLEIIKDANSRLVIELKYYGHDQQLEQRVVDLVEAADMADSVAIMSLKLDGVNKLKALRPDWTGGLLAATSVGDITRLNADFLAVNQNMANPAFIRRAHKAGKQVFVWTVNDPLSLSHWMSMGVDGVITDEPAMARKILAQRADLSPAQRLMLAGVMFFGKPEAIKEYRDQSP